MQNLNINSVRAMAKDKNLIKTANTIFQALAYEQTIREIIEPKKQEIVDFYKFKASKENRRFIEGTIITRHQDIYLADDDDFKLYLAEMNRFHTEQGFKKPSPDHCPLLMAESLTRDAKKVFVDLLEPYTAISFGDLMRSYSSYKNYIELNLTFFAPLVKTH